MTIPILDAAAAKQALERAHTVVRAARRYNLRPYGVENGALRTALDEALAAYDEEQING